ncbi:DUF4389 domain-containing protein [Streptomyces sp. NPDC001904]|uniref:DUF4389 domain-containing protein n=1 Tax=Streptomyces sp. NPDC001904 TaxID=3154531 RepID=UPI0033260CD4
MAAPSPPYGTVPPTPGAEPLPELDVPPPGRQHRLTVFLRLLLLLPHVIVLAVLSVVTFFVVVAAWCATLVLGRVPDPLWRWLAGYVGYETRFDASAMLLTDRYPPFQVLGEPAGYPVRVLLRATPLNRLAVFFRLILVIPAAIVTSLSVAGWWALAVVTWLIVLILGRMPQPLFEATAAVLRYRMRVSAYLLLLTSAYPKRLFGDQSSADAAIGVVRGPSATRPLMMSTSGQVLVVVFLLLGLLSGGGNAVTRDGDSGTDSAPAGISSRT